MGNKGIIIDKPFIYKNSGTVDEKQYFESLNDMVNYPEEELADVSIAGCYDPEKNINDVYVFRKDSPSDYTMGKWKLLGGGIISKEEVDNLRRLEESNTASVNELTTTVNENKTTINNYIDTSVAMLESKIDSTKEQNATIKVTLENNINEVIADLATLENKVDGNVARLDSRIDDVTTIANSKATADDITTVNARIDSLVVGQTETTDNEETRDIRIGVDGIVYSSAGESVRQQITNLNNTIIGNATIVEELNNDYKSFKEGAEQVLKTSGTQLLSPTWEDGFYYNKDGTDGELGSWTRLELPCVAGDNFKITYKGFRNTQTYLILPKKSDGTYLTSLALAHNSSGYADYIYTVPEDVTSLLISTKIGYEVAIKKLLYKSLRDEVEDTLKDYDNKLIDTNYRIDDIFNSLNYTIPVELEFNWIEGSYYTTGGTISEQSTWKRADYDVVAGDEYKVSYAGTTANGVALILPIDSDGKVISKWMSHTANGYTDKIYTIPNGCVKILISTRIDIPVKITKGAGITVKQKIEDVRGEIKAVDDKIGLLEDTFHYSIPKKLDPTWITGEYWKTNGDIAKQGSWQRTVIDVVENEQYKINYKGCNGVGVVLILPITELGTPSSSKGLVHTTNGYKNYYYTVPKGYNKLYVSTRIDTPVTIEKVIGKSLKEELEDELTIFRDEMKEVNHALSFERQYLVQPNWVEGEYYYSDGTIQTQSSWERAIIDGVVAGDTYSFTYKGTKATNVPLVIPVKSDGTLIYTDRIEHNGTALNNYVYTVPADCTRLYLSTRIDTPITMYKVVERSFKEEVEDKIIEMDKAIEKVDSSIKYTFNNNVFLDWIEGEYYASNDGSIMTQGSWMRVELDVFAGDVYKLTYGGTNANNVSLVLPVKNDGTLFTTNKIPHNGTALTNYEYIVPDECVQLWICTRIDTPLTMKQVVQKTLKDEIQYLVDYGKLDTSSSSSSGGSSSGGGSSIGSSLEGLQWTAVGDSITAQNIYVKQIISKTKINSTGNKGINSTTIAVHDGVSNSICERVVGLNGNAGYDLEGVDYYTIFGGINDYSQNSPMGDMSSTDNHTFIGALKQMCEHILSAETHPKLILICPLQSYRNTEMGMNSEGYYVEDYVNSIIKVANYYSIPYVNLFTEGGLNAINIKAETNATTSDGLHPNAYGTSLYIDKIIFTMETGVSVGCPIFK